MRSPGRCAAIFLAIMALPAVAPAQSRDPVAAELLFRAGRDALDQGDYETACSKLAESHRLDPAAGTLINLGACNEKRSKLATAWSNWREALELMARDDERRPRAEQHIAELEARLPRLTIELAPQSPAGAEVWRDRVLLGAPSLGLAVPVDPGTIAVEVRTPGHAVRQYSVEMREAQSERLVVEAGPKVAPEVAVGPAPPPARPPVARVEPLSSESGDGSSLRTVGLVLGGVGIASLAVGGVTGVLALNRADTIRDTCEQDQGSYLCDDDGLDAASSGETLSTVSTITTLAGAGALLAGAGLWLLGGPSKDQGVRLAPAVAGQGASASWTRKF